jgi:transcription antitermination factor NusG
MMGTNNDGMSGSGVSKRLVLERRALRNWYAIWTRSRNEHVVRERLKEEAIEAFLPTVTRWSHWKDRRKPIEWPLFPSYCFARFNESERLRVLKCRGVVGIVSVNGRPAPVPAFEIENIKLLVGRTLTFDPCPFVREGAMVTITGGPLRGVVGRLLQKDARRASVVLSVTSIGQAVRVEVNARDISPA